MNTRAERVSEQIKMELADLLLRQIKDPRIDFVTVTGVEMTDDLQQATIYITILGDKEKQNQTFAVLDKARGYIRGEISKRVKLRKAPELHFVIDESIEYGTRIDELLRNLSNH